ncbi:MAG: hypothetical protein LBU74_04640 [Methanobacteriaceae archaeon]|jgi:hypothetical protein|nr:hypothetical protein [Candidatus Methanorudis spinitermitis]
MDIKQNTFKKITTQIATNICKRSNLSENSFINVIINNNNNLNYVSRNSPEADYSFYIIAIALAKFNKNNFNNNYLSFNTLAKFNFNTYSKYNNNYHYNFYNFSIVEKISNFNYFIFEKNIHFNNYLNYTTLFNRLLVNANISYKGISYCSFNKNTSIYSKDIFTYFNNYWLLEADIHSYLFINQEYYNRGYLKNFKKI